MSHQEFESPDHLRQFVDQLIARLQNLGLNAEPLISIQSSVFTTSSEWLGELGTAIRKVEDQVISDTSIINDCDRVMKEVCKIWPKL